MRESRRASLLRHDPQTGPGDLPTLVGIAAAIFFARKLDLLSLGDRAARHVGVDVERFRVLCILVVAVLTASARTIGAEPSG